MVELYFLKGENYMMINKELKGLFQTGYESEDRLDLAVISLKQSFISYFSTYQAVSKAFDFNQSINEYEPTLNQKYKELYVESILHFHHFVELLFKDILIQNDKNPKNLGFDALRERVDKLISCISKNEPKYDFIKDANEWLKELNRLRNTIWHTGVFVLNYGALDKVFGNFFLPFVINVMELKEYRDLKEKWMYKPVACEIDPISDIIKAYAETSNSKQDINLRHIAYLKEIGRAAYNLPDLDPFTELVYGNKRKAYAAVRHEEKHENCQVETCPVCRKDTLIVYIHEDLQDEEIQTHSLIWNFEVKCFLCSFNIRYELGNASKFGLSLPNYF